MMHQLSCTGTTNCSIALATAAELAPGRLAEGSTDHRVSRLAARRAVRAALPGALEIRIDRRAGATPAVVGTTLPLALSLSHCDGRAAAIAAPAPARVGIDLERSNAIASGHARYFLSPRERSAIGTHSLAALWALKEAAWKALALPDDTCFHDVELAIDGEGTVEAVHSRGDTFFATATLAAPWPGYVLATVQLDAPRKHVARRPEVLR